MIDVKYAQGVVEDNVDPEGKARVRVRIDGYHTQVDKTTQDYGIRTDELDWYPVLMPATSSSRGGRGASPSGLLIGDRVGLFIMDPKYLQSALVIGTIHGDGDVSNISMGGIEGLKSDAVENTNNNLSTAPKLDEREYDEEGGLEVDDVGFDIFFKSLVHDEGFKDKPYYDKFGFPTIGIGTLLIKQPGYPLGKTWSIVEKKLGKKITKGRITEEDAKRLAINEINKIKSEINQYPLLASVYNKVSQTRKYGLMHMCYQMGTAGASKFTNSLRLMLAEQWTDAYRNLLKSKWASQTPNRAMRVASIIRDNNFGAYPLKVQGGSRFKRGLLPKMGSGDVNIVEQQKNLMMSTKGLRSIRNIETVEDIQNVLTEVTQYDRVVSDFNNMVDAVEGNIKTISEFNALEFSKKYMKRFVIFIKELFERVKSFVVNQVNDAIEGLEKTIDAISLIIERIFFNTDKVSEKIDNSIIEASEKFHEEAEEEEENGVEFTEPPSEYAGEYPHVKTEISESGHIYEVDDTPGFERIKEQHRSGTFREIGPNGRLVEKTVSDRYTIVSNDDHILIEGSGKITIGGNHIINIIGDSKQIINGDVTQIIRGSSKTEIDGNSDILIKGDSDVHIEGNSKVHIEGNFDGEIEGDAKLLIKGNYEGTVEGNATELVKGDYSGTVEGNTTLLAKGTLEATIEGDTTIYAKSNLTATVDGDSVVNLKSNANINVDGETTVIMKGNSTMTCESDLKLTVNGNTNGTFKGNLDSKVQGNWTNSVDGNIELKAVGAIKLLGNKIYMDRS